MPYPPKTCRWTVGGRKYTDFAIEHIRVRFSIQQLLHSIAKWVTSMSIDAAQLRMAISGLDIKLEQLAKDSGVAIQTLSRIQRGSSARSGTLTQIADTLRIKGVRFEQRDGLSWVGVPPPPPPIPMQARPRKEPPPKKPAARRRK